jgi:ribosomal protein S18 acetylase RimI-like enzyme
MSDSEYPAWRAISMVTYAQEFVDAGILEPEEATARADADFSRLLTDGVATKNHDLSVAEVDGTPVGTLWVAFTEQSAGLEAFIYEVEVMEARRGQGWGRAIMQACHDHCLDRGAVAVRLNVFGHNDVARRLYDSLGYHVTSTSMKLDLAPMPH